jgi:hypothetical protein
MLWSAIVVCSAAARDPLRLAAVEVGTAAGNLSERDGVQARVEWSKGKTFHVGVQGSWNRGGFLEPEYYVTLDPATTVTTDWHDVRALGTLSAHLDDRHVQVGVGLAAGPWIFVGRSAYAVSYSGEVVQYSGTDVWLAAFWTTSIRVRIVDGVGLYLAATGDVSSTLADSSFGIGWTR